MRTLEAILNRANVTVPDELIAAIDVPVISDAPQRQGDVLIVPCGGDVPNPPKDLEMHLVPREGIPVVRGEIGGQTHLLMSTGPVLFGAAPHGHDPDRIALGWVEVPEGEIADLIHTDEHGANSFGPGTYYLTGKREQGEITRRVMD